MGLRYTPVLSQWGGWDRKLSFPPKDPACYGLNCVPAKDVGVLNPSIYGRDLVWKGPLQM